MDLNRSLEQDLEPGLTEADDVVGGRSAPLKKPRRKRIVSKPDPDKMVPRKSPALAEQQVVQKLNQTTDPERP